jgi:phosphoribosylformylglycinamidine cyclo-ligase
LSRKPDAPGSSYRDSGVDIDAGQEAVRLMHSAVRSTWDAGVLGQYGAFAGLYAQSSREGAGDILAVTIDGVGTKVKVAVMCGRYDTVGQDLVNHCVNDLLVQRARPLLFADYFASGKIEPAVVAAAVGGMAEACRAAGCNLIAGETAEMPGVYAPGEIDIAGCMIGLAKGEELEGAEPVAPGDVLLGLESSGLHTNGYSLARRLLFEKSGYGVDTHLPELGCTVGEELLKIHRPYFPLLHAFIGDPRLHGLAHLTGGGFYDNIARILPEDCGARIEKGSWAVPPVFRLLQSIGDLPDGEAYRVFNMGIGMVLAVDPTHVHELAGLITRLGCPAHLIGEVTEGEPRVVVE